MSTLERNVFKRIPFYGSYAGFYRAMRILKNVGLPRRLETRFFAGKLDAEASRLIAGFGALGWIDKSGQSTDGLRKLVAAFGTETWGTALAEVLREAYPYLDEVDLENAPNDKLREAFVSYLGRAPETLRNAETFFLCLAAEAGRPMSEGFSKRAARGIGEAKRWMIQLAESELTDKKETEAKEPVTVVRTEPPSSDKITRLAGQIIDLTALLSEGDMTDQEKKAVALTISVLARRMNAA